MLDIRLVSDKVLDFKNRFIKSNRYLKATDMFETKVEDYLY